MNKNLWTILISIGLSTLFSCNNSAPSDIAVPEAIEPASQTLVSFPESGHNLRISLTDAPSKDLKSVFVNIDHVELFVRKDAAEKRLVIGQDTGMTDLMTLRNGILLPLQDLNIATGLEITAIRLVLKGDNNHSIKSDDSRCEMQTPSGQQAGIKIKIAQSFILENDYIYSMVMDFDAEKSVVLKGNGECLLKPVLKLLKVTKTPKKTTSNPPNNSDTTNDDGTDNITETPDNTINTPVTDGTDSNTGGDPATGGDFEIPMDPIDEPAIITTDETFLL